MGGRPGHNQSSHITFHCAFPFILLSSRTALKCVCLFVCLLIFRTLIFLRSPGQLFCTMPLNLDLLDCLLMVIIWARIPHRYFCDMLSAHIRRHMMISLMTQLRWCPHSSPFPGCLYCELISNPWGDILRLVLHSSPE